MRFKTKLALGFSALMVLMVIVFLILFLGFYQKRIIENVENHRTSLARHFSGSITNMVLIRDTLQLKNTIKKFCKDLNYVDYVFVIDSDGQLLAHSFDYGFPSELFSTNPLPEDKTITSKIILTKKGRIRDFAVRPVKHMLTEIHVGMNEEVFYKQIEYIANMTIFIMLVCLSLGLLLVYFMSRSFSKPLQNLNLAMDKFGKGDLDYRLEEKGGHEILNLIQGYNRMAGSIHEAAAKQQQAEERIKRLNSILRAIRNVNQMIVVEKDRDSLLQKACNILIEARGYDAAWLGFSRDAETFATVKGSGFSEGVSRFSEHVVGGDHPPCIRRAVSQKEKLVIVDKPRECEDCFFKDACTNKEAAIIRVKHADRFYGLLAILFAPDVTAEEEENELLKEVADDIAIALCGIELEEALRESEQRLADIIEFLPDATLAIDLDGKVIAWNRAIEEMTGVKAEDMLGKGNYEYALPFYGTRRPILIDLIFKPDREIEEKYSFVRREGEALIAEANVPFVKEPGLFLWGKASPMYDHKGNIIGAIESIRDITKRKQAERKVQQSLKEKEVMLKEIHHRVKNNMQVISSLLNLQAGHISDERALELFKECQNRVRTMALIHERLYQSNDLASIDFADYIRSLTGGLLRMYRIDPDVIKLNIYAEDVFLDINTSIPCGLIINELVSNAFKHAFPEGREGEISITFKADNRYTLIVSDNGVSFPGDLDFRKTETLGMQLVNILTEQLHGTIEIDRSGGTSFKIVWGK